MSAQLRVVASDLRFPEGPVALGDGVFAVAEMQGGAVARVAADGSTSVLATTGGAPNGLAVLADGTIVVANNGGLSINADGSYWHAPDAADGRVELIEHQGAVVLCDALPGDAPHRPNDVCAAPDGGVVVTDSSNWEDMRNLVPGRIVHVARSGAATQLAELAAMPNGIAFTADGALLVAQSLTRRIWSYPVLEGQPLELGEPVEVCRLPSGSSPDGLCLATDGRMFVCGSISDSVFVFDAGGELVDTIETGAGSQPTNCCLDGGSLYVTLAKLGQLVAIDVGAEPLDQVHGGAS